MPPRITPQAETWKQKGNDLFARGKWSAAIEAYTEARLMCPQWEVPLVNRALCYRKRGEWKKVEEDCRSALLLDHDNPKAHYMLGLALLEDHNYPDACKTLTKALEGARNRGATMLDEIWRELARAKYAVWLAFATQKAMEAEALQARVEASVRGAASAAILTTQQERAPDGEQRVKRIESQLKNTLDGLRETFKEARERHVPDEIPDCYLCKLTMEPFRDPVVTPAGFTYERAALFQHFAKLGHFDPVSRAKVLPTQCVSNLALRSATQAYLDAHGWAWGECMATAPEPPR